MGDFLASYVSYETFEPPTFLIQSISPIPPQIRLSCGVICKDHCGELLVGQQFFSRDWGASTKTYYDRWGIQNLVKSMGLSIGISSAPFFPYAEVLYTNNFEGWINICIL